MTISVPDLIYVNDMVKVLKASTFVWYQDILMGIDDMNYIIYVKLDSSKVMTYPTRAMSINQREYAAFIKSISNEPFFELDESRDITILDNITKRCNISFSRNMDEIIRGRSWIISYTDMNMINLPERDMTEELEFMFSLKSSSKPVYYHYDRQHMFTLFAGIFPLLKGDRIFVTLRDESQSTFLVRFRIKKKHCDLFAYVNYLRV